MARDRALSAVMHRRADCNDPASLSADLPVSLGLTGGAITLRLTKPTDQDALKRFFRRIPPEDALFLRDDFARTDIFERSVRERERTTWLGLLAVDRRRIVGYGTLHRHHTGGDQHVGDLRIVVEPKYRNRGIGRKLLQTLKWLAFLDDSALNKLTLEIVPDTERAAIHVAEALGFSRGADYSAHVRYYAGVPHRIDHYECRVGEFTAPDDPASHMF